MRRLRKVLPVAVAVGLVGGLAAFASLPAGSPAAVNTVAGEATQQVLGADGIGYMLAGSHLEYANDGSGDYWSVNATGEFCPMCGPSRGSGGANAAGRDLNGSEHALDKFTVTFASSGPQQGLNAVSATEPGAWPVAPSQLVTKVIKAGSGRIADGMKTEAVVDVANFDAETGEELSRSPIRTNGSAPSDRVGRIIDWAVDGQAAGARVLVAIPGEQHDKANLFILDIKTVAAVPECPDGSWAIPGCWSEGGSLVLPAPVAKGVGDVTVGGAWTGRVYSGTSAPVTR